MSEQMNTQSRNLRIGLLTTVSAVALLGAAWTSPVAATEDEDRPTVWIELGGQLERANNSQETFMPPFFDGAPAAVLAPMLDAQKPPQYAIGGEAKITLSPSGSDWVFTASLRYGRSNATRQLHYQSHHETTPFTQSGRNLGITGSALAKMGDAQGGLSATHFILDFQAGKDVGLGLFGQGSASVLSAGVRFAQFTSSTDLLFHARPAYMAYPFGKPGKYSLHSRYFRSNTAVIQSKRSTEAFGPSLSWDASARAAGNNTGLSVMLGRECRNSIRASARACSSLHGRLQIQRFLRQRQIQHPICAHAARSGLLAFRNGSVRRGLRGVFVPLRRCENRFRLSRRFLLRSD